MVTVHGRVDTDRPARYLVQLCHHADQVGRRGLHRPLGHDRGWLPEMPDDLRAEWSDTAGIITFQPWGRCDVEVVEGALVLRVEGPDEDSVDRIQGVIDRNIGRFGRREQLAVRWRDPLPSTDPAPQASEVRTGEHRRRRGRFLAAAGVLGVVLVVAAHVVMAGAAAVVTRWLGWTALGVAVVPVLIAGAHLLLPGVAFGLRRFLGRRRGGAPTGSDPDADGRS